MTQSFRPPDPPTGRHRHVQRGPNLAWAARAPGPPARPLRRTKISGSGRSRPKLYLGTQSNERATPRPRGGGKRVSLPDADAQRQRAGTGVDSLKRHRSGSTALDSRGGRSGGARARPAPGALRTLVGVTSPGNNLQSAFRPWTQIANSFAGSRPVPLRATKRRPAGEVPGAPLAQREVARGPAGAITLATTMASSPGVTGLGTCIWNPVRSASSRS